MRFLEFRDLFELTPLLVRRARVHGRGYVKRHHGKLRVHAYFVYRRAQVKTQVGKAGRYSVRSRRLAETDARSGRVR